MVEGENMDITKVKEIADKITNNVAKVIVGKDEVIELILAAMFAGGHVLIEDNPGTGKTMLTKVIAKSISGEYKRVQFTPDLMPSDVTGLNVYDRKISEFKLVKGPVFTNILLADEINRATPRTQSSLLEAMEERQVTIDGNTMKLPEPFMVFATENPVETTGTYPLPEAQLDRFIMKLNMGVTDKSQELNIIEKYINDNPLEGISAVCNMEDILDVKQLVSKVFVHNCIREYIVDIILSTRDNKKLVAGISTRGTLALVKCCQAYAAIKGRNYVEPDDVKKLAPYVLAHRLIIFGSGFGHRNSYEFMEDIVASIDVPVEDWEK